MRLSVEDVNIAMRFMLAIGFTVYEPNKPIMPIPPVEHQYDELFYSLVADELRMLMFPGERKDTKPQDRMACECHRDFASKMFDTISYHGGTYPVIPHYKLLPEDGMYWIVTPDEVRHSVSATRKTMDIGDPDIRSATLDMIKFFHLANTLGYGVIVSRLGND